MTKVSTVVTFAAAAVVAMTAVNTASAVNVRRLDNEDSGSFDFDHWVDGSGDEVDDSSSSDSMFANELPDAEEDAVPKYGQCGGIGYFGNAKCSRGFVCVISDPWFAQCLPADAMMWSWGKKKRSHRSKLYTADDELLVETASDGADDVDVVPAWEQCGGKGVDFDFSRDDSLSEDETPKQPCEDGYTCEVINEWYYQCQPLPDLTGINLWEQCGGEDYMGPTECTTGAVCKHFNDWYSQCVPKEQEFS